MIVIIVTLLLLLLLLQYSGIYTYVLHSTTARYTALPKHRWLPLLSEMGAKKGERKRETERDVFVTAERDVLAGHLPPDLVVD